MRVKFAKWGNSLGLRIPAAFAREIGVSEDSSVELSIKGRRLVVAPVADAQAFDLDDLVSQITDKNRHGEIPTGRAKGREFS